MSLVSHCIRRPRDCEPRARHQAGAEGITGPRRTGSHKTDALQDSSASASFEPSSKSSLGQVWPAPRGWSLLKGRCGFDAGLPPTRLCCFPAIFSGLAGLFQPDRKAYISAIAVYSIWQRTKYLFPSYITDPLPPSFLLASGLYWNVDEDV